MNWRNEIPKKCKKKNSAKQINMPPENPHRRTCLCHQCRLLLDAAISDTLIMANEQTHAVQSL